jgi:hypothetical protein
MGTEMDTPNSMIVTATLVLILGGISQSTYAYTASVNASVQDKILNEIVDSNLSYGNYNFSTYGSDSHIDYTFTANHTVTANSAITTSGSTWDGYASSASGSVDASATASYGALHVSSSGSGSSIQGSSTITSTGYALFQDYLTVNANSINPSQFVFGLGVPLLQTSCRLKFLKKIKFEIKDEIIYKVFCRLQRASSNKSL